MKTKMNSEERMKNFFNKVYSWMFLGLLISAVVAYIVPTEFSSFFDVLMSNSLLLILFFLLYLGFVWFLSGRILKISYTTAKILFIVQAILLGIFISSIFVIYELGSIGLIFLITAGIFGIMSLIGYTTKVDLSRLGTILMIGLVGIIIVGLINYFIGSSLIDTLISILGVVIFIGFTAYDTQKLKKISTLNESEDMIGKLAIVGALALYLDFVNLFLDLLSLFGRRR